MLTQVATSPKSFEDYRPLVGDEAIDEIYRLVEPLRGARMLHINATARGGGVAEILTSLVPLMNDIGIPTEWHIMEGSGEFYQVTKALHNSLQGMQMEWTPEMWATWELYNQRTAELMEGDYDFVVVHDPQPAGVLHYLKEAGSVSDGSKWTWRCHIDTTNAQQEAWSLLLPYLHDYGTAIFTLKQFVKRDLAGPRIRVIPPAIDPLSEKNVPASGDTIRQVLTRFNVDPDRPFMLQASRMDAWKDPIGVLESYHIIKPSIPSLQLVFLVAIADDDPEGWAYLDQVKASAGSDPDVHILPDILNGIGDPEVNAFQTGAQVVLQKSLREGFGLAVSEALWKGRPVVGGRTGGIPLQVLHGKTGYLVSSPEECAQWAQHLLQDPEKADRLGMQGRELVREKFLITRYLRDYLKVYRSLDRRRNRLHSASYSPSVAGAAGGA
jgi:trehalose synthase